MQLRICLWRTYPISERIESGDRLGEINARESFERVYPHLVSLRYLPMFLRIGWEILGYRNGG